MWSEDSLDEMDDNRILEIVQPSSIGEGTIKPRSYISLALRIVSPDEAIPYEAEILKARSQNHIIKLLDREGRRRAGTKFMRGQ